MGGHVRPPGVRDALSTPLIDGIPGIPGIHGILAIAP
jgi:hypothetical protein